MVSILTSHALPLHVLHSLQTVHHRLVARQTSQPPPPPPPSQPFPPPRIFNDALLPAQFNSAPPPIPTNMGDDTKDKDIHSEETILFLFLTFGILIVLILILLLLGFQTYLSWRLAHALIEDDPSSTGMEQDFRAWDRARKERRKALRALEKGRGLRASWGYGSGSRRSGNKGDEARLTTSDEEMGMTGARGSSMMLDKFNLGDGKEKKPFWSIKRWI